MTVSLRTFVSVSLVFLLSLFIALPAFARDGEGEDTMRASATAQSIAVEHEENSGKQEMSNRGRGSDDDIDEDEEDDEDREVELDRGHMGTTTGDIRHPDEVKNFGQLRSFAAHIINEERQVNRVNLSSTTVRAEVTTPASLLGVIPASVQTRVEVKNDGKVDVSYPWYAFFFKKNQDAVTEQVTTAVNEVLTSSSLDTETQNALSAKLQATILNSIVSSLKSLFE